MKEKLVVTIMGQNCERFIGMCLKSVKDADKIVYCDGGSTDKFKQYFDEQIKQIGIDIDWIENKYDQEDIGMNGKQRNFYLKYLKKNYKNYWTLVLDADEVVDDLDKIKKFIQTAKKGLYSIKMRHFISDLGHEDATREKHFVLNRLFYINEADTYPEIEHSVLVPKNPENVFVTDITTIWHLAYIPNLWEIKKRYENHLKKSTIHTPQFLDWWYKAHLFGEYPKVQINLIEIPSLILEEFGIDKDELYFQNRGLEAKHFVMAKQWTDYFKEKIKRDIKFIEFGCGRAPFGYALLSYGNLYHGVELSKYAVDNAFVQVNQGNILDYYTIPDFDVALAIDVLEHLEYNDLDKAIDNLIKHTNKYILVSVPVIGDPNLNADPTHIIKESKEWWIKKFTDKNLKLIKTPGSFLYHQQLLIFEKK